MNKSFYQAAKFIRSLAVLYESKPTTFGLSTCKAKFLFVLINGVEGAKCWRDLWRSKGKLN